MTQVNAQDVMWLDTAAEEIRQIRFPAYFVAQDPNVADPSEFFVITASTEMFRERFGGAWRRLTKCDTLKIHLFQDASDKDDTVAKWYVVLLTFLLFFSDSYIRDCKFVNFPKGIGALNSHPTNDEELVLLVRRPLPQAPGYDFPIRTLESREKANRRGVAY